MRRDSSPVWTSNTRTEAAWKKIVPHGSWYEKYPDILQLYV